MTFSQYEASSIEEGWKGLLDIGKRDGNGDILYINRYIIGSLGDPKGYQVMIDQNRKSIRLVAVERRKETERLCKRLERQYAQLVEYQKRQSELLSKLCKTLGVSPQAHSQPHNREIKMLTTVLVRIRSLIRVI